MTTEEKRKKKVEAFRAYREQIKRQNEADKQRRDTERLQDEEWAKWNESPLTS